MNTAPTFSGFTAAGSSTWAGQTWSHDPGQDVDNANEIIKVFEHSTNIYRGFSLIYYKTGTKAGKQYINVELPNPDHQRHIVGNTTFGNPGSVENVTQGTGGQSGTDEVEYAALDEIKMWDPTYQYPLVVITTDSTWDFTSSGSGAGSGSGPSIPTMPVRKNFSNFW